LKRDERRWRGGGEKGEKGRKRDFDEEEFIECRKVHESANIL
jgi:hypothetical protein